VILAGLRVPDDDVRELARLVDEPTRSLLEKALGLGTAVVALTIDDRERILWALDDVRTDARTNAHPASVMARSRMLRLPPGLLAGTVALRCFDGLSIPAA
jgi:hypothetical protein